MSLLTYFSTAPQKILAKALVEQLAQRLPASMIESRRKILSVNKVTRLLEEVYAVAADHQRTQKPGFIKRAVLANHFKWSLQDKGYPQDFIDVATEGLVMELAKASGQQANKTRSP